MQDIKEYLLNINLEGCSESKMNCILSTILELYLEHGSKKLGVDEIVREQSPRRRTIREFVRETPVASAEIMKKQHKRKHNIGVQDFNVGERVGVKIPKEDRSKTDRLRIPGVIKGVKGSRRKMYKIASEYGVLAGLFSSRELERYHGIICEKYNGIEISLRSAARQDSVTKEYRSICKCRAASQCSHGRCGCKRLKILCTSRCHGGADCRNKEEEIGIDIDSINNVENSNMGRTEGTFMEILDFHAPLAGGNIQFEERRLHFVNTCPIDNWLCFLGFICRHFRHEFNELVNLFVTFHPEMKAAINDVKEYAYNEAKLKLTNLNNIRCVDNIINFYGTKVEYFINHIKLIMQYTLRST